MHTRANQWLIAMATCVFPMVLFPGSPALRAEMAGTPKPDEVLAGLRRFYRQTAETNGSFRPGRDPQYEGMADSAASDMAAVTYAVVLHKTFGWKLPHEEKTKAWLLGRQNADGAFINIKGTLDPASPAARLYNTTQGLVALHALGLKPKYNPLPVFAQILKGDHKTLPPYTTSFFPLAYLAYDQSFPPEEDCKMRALMVPAEDGYLHNHIAASFHMVHYDRLINRKTAKGASMLKRVLRDQKEDGSWMLNPPARDRHATYDAAFVLRQLGADRPECRRALGKAAAWALKCRNLDGGFGHFPGSPSDADAIYFQIGTLVMAGYLKPVDPLPQRPHLYSWGHLMPPPKRREGGE